MCFLYLMSVRDYLPHPSVTLYPEQDVEGPALPELPGPGWYSQGNWTQLHSLLQRLTGKASPKVLSLFTFTQLATSLIGGFQPITGYDTVNQKDAYLENWQHFSPPSINEYIHFFFLC